jgi:uncharacterized protein
MAETAAVPIHTGQDFYVPYFLVKVAGRVQEQDVVRDILSVTYKDNIKDLDSFEITINNWDAETRGIDDRTGRIDKETRGFLFKYSDSDRFDPGKALELSMGYYGKDAPRVMMTGQITALRPMFPAGGAPTLAVSGLNILHKLRTEPRSQAYENKTDTQVAREIARSLGLEFKTMPVSGEEPYEYLLQDNQFDIIFLMERARRIGYAIYVDETGAKPALVFARSTDVVRPTYELRYGWSLIDFKPDLTTANQVAEVTVRAWDKLHKEKIEEKATRAEIKVKGVGEKGGQAAIEEAFKQRREIIATKPVESRAEAKTLALRTLEENAKDMVKATGSTVGLPDLRAGSVVMITGVGRRFSGRYFVTGTTHTIGDSGYTTQFECRREEV